MQILLAKPRGFCAGVDRAIDTVHLALEVYGTPLYVKHAIVHNDYVVKDLEKQGVVFVEKVVEVPEGANLVFSAHGSPPSDYITAKKRNLNVIDATCPLVTKVHLEALRYAKEGYSIILVGHKGHVELLGTKGEAPDVTVVVETVADVQKLNMHDGEKIAVLTQTTLSVDDTKEILETIKGKFPQALLPPSSDICYATTNRQRAVKSLAEQSDVVLVVGSEESSNTNRLVEVAKAMGTPAYRINIVSDIDTVWLEKATAVGVTSGASAPEYLVDEVVNYLTKDYAGVVEELVVMDEKVWFDFPTELKQEAAKRDRGAALLSKHTIEADSIMSA